MSLIEYVNQLAAQGIELWVAEGKLQYRAPKELITPQLLADLKQRKVQLIELLGELSASVGTYPLSYSQKSLWALHQLNPSSAAYNVTYVAQLINELRLEDLERCFDYLVARHPILRTRYAVIEGEPRQQVSTVGTARIEVRELALTDATQIDAWIEQEANQPFDLTQSPLRLKLLINCATEGSGTQLPRHVLLINVHHIAADFWSLEILVRELSLLYSMASTDQALRLPACKLQYKDCVAHEAQRLSGAEGEALAEFWRRELAGELPILHLPTDSIRPPFKTENGRVHLQALSPELSLAVREFAKAAQATPYMLLLGVYQLFLFLHTSQEHLLIGAPTAGRAMAGSESVLGHFVNTTVLNCRFERLDRFTELLARTRALMLRVLAHENYPLPLLVEQLRPPRDASRSPIFQIMYNWNQAQRQTRPAMDGDGALVVAMLAAASTGTRGATHDLTLNIYDYDSHYVTAWTYNTDLFASATVARFATQFVCLLQQVLLDPTRILADYRLIEQPQRSAIIEAALKVKSSHTAGILEGFLQRAAAQPQQLALLHGEEQITHADLLQIFQRLRAELIMWGIGLGSEVALTTTDPVALLMAVLAVGDLGGQAVTVQAAPQQEVSSRGVVRVLSAGPAGSEPLQGAQRIDVFELQQAAMSLQAALSLDTASPVLLPEGIKLQVAVLWHAAALGTGALLATQPLYSLLSAQGAHAVQALAARARRHRLSTFVLPERVAAQCIRDVFTHVDRLVLLGGSSAPPAEHLIPLDVRLMPLEEIELGRTPLVFAWRGTAQGWVLQEPLAAVVTTDFGDVADLETNGTLHLCQPREGTQAAPLPEYPAAMLVTTAVRAKRTEHAIVYRGLHSRVVKVQGSSFHLDEIEAFIAAQSEVRDVVCLVRMLDQQRQLIAYSVLHAAADPSQFEAQLRRRMKLAMPEFMHPAAYVWLPQLPLDAAGLLDEAQLPPVTDRFASVQVAPRNAIEAQLLAVWSEVLPSQQIGVQSNFFELGGDSILGAIIISKAQQQGLYVEPRDIFENATIAELAAVVRLAPRIQVEQRPVTGTSLLAPAQQWFVDRIRVDRSHFNQALLLQLAEVPEMPLLRQALTAVTLQHDVLRSHFASAEDGWLQIFDMAVPTPDVLLKIERCPHAAPDFDTVYAAAIDDAQRSLNIETGPLLRAVWLDCGQLAHSRLLLVVHHLVIDGISWGLLLEDLSTCYQQLRKGMEVQLPLKTNAYKDWVFELQRYARSEDSIQELKYWQHLVGIINDRVFASSTPAGLPIANAVGGNLQADSAVEAVVLSQESTDAFRGKAHQAYNTDPMDLLLAAFYLASRRCGSAKSMLVDVESHGRTPLFGELDINRTIGWFTAIYPVFLELPTEEGLPHLIKAIKEQLRRIPNNGIGYGALRYLTNAAGMVAKGEATMLFNYLGQMEQMLPRAGLFVGQPELAPAMRSPRQRRSHALELSGYVRAGHLHLECIYDQTHSLASDIRMFLQGFRDALQELINHCLAPEAGGMTPSDLPDIDVDQQQLDELLDELALLEE